MSKKFDKKNPDEIVILKNIVVILKNIVFFLGKFLNGISIPIVAWH